MRSRAASSFRLFVAAMGVVIVTGSGVKAADVYWSGGGTTANWTNVNNWWYLNRPNDDGNDRAIFEGSHARLSATVNETYWLYSLRFEKDEFGVSRSYTINRSNDAWLEIKSGIANTSPDSQTVNVPIHFTDNAEISNDNDAGGKITLTAEVQLNNKTVRVEPSSSNILISGQIYQSGRVVVDGPGTLELTGSNSWTGALELQRGTVSYGAGANLGAVGNWIDFNADSGETPTLRRFGNGTTSSPMNFVKGEGRIAIASGVSVTHSGAIVGTGDLAKTEGGNLILTGVADRTGKTYVREGTLQLDGSAILPDNLLEVSSGATLSYLSTVSDRVGALSGGGTINLGSNGTWGVGTLGVSSAGGNGGGTFSGSINGANTALLKEGTGTLNLTGNNALTGYIAVSEGKLLFNNTGATSAGGTAPAFVLAGATIGGDGSTNGSIDVYDGGTVEPSSSIVPGVGIGSLKAGIVALRPGSTMKAEISSGGGNDVLNSATTAFIDRATLVLSTTLGLPVNTATTRTILHADGGLTGTFGTITGMEMSNGKVLAVTYGANDVVVTAATPGDADLNGIVDFDDLLTLAQNYDSDITGRTWSDADFNGNGIANFDDLLALAQNYGAGSLSDAQSTLLGETFASDWTMAQSLVPEPASLSVLIGVVAVRRGRR